MVHISTSEDRPTDHVLHISVTRAIAIRECFESGEDSDEHFAGATKKLIIAHIKSNPNSLTHSIAHLHPEIHLWLHETLSIKTCLTTPTIIPIRYYQEHVDATRQSHIYPDPPCFATPPDDLRWSTTDFRTPTSMTIALHREANERHIHECVQQLRNNADWGHYGILLIEN